MALSDADLHWIPMNRSKFNQIRRMFDVKSEEAGSKTLPRMPCDKCTSPRIRYTSAESVSALAQIRALLRPVDPDSCSTSSRSRSTSEDSVELRTRNHQLPSNGLVVIDPLLCSKNLSHINDNSKKGEINVSTEKTRNERSVCETVAEVTENVTVSSETERDSADTTNNNANHVVDHSNSNGDIPSADNEAADNQPVIENGDIRIGNLQNGEVNNENDSILTNGDTVTGKLGNLDIEISSSSEKLDNDKENNSYLENGSSDSSVDEEIRNNNIFLKMVNEEAEVLTKEREYFLSLLDEATAVSEEAGGRVMASCGKANLLLTSKFKQYRGLCSEYEKTSRKMTADDMQGFWELILLQVNDVKKMFTALRNLHENNWVIPKSPMPKKKGVATPRTPASNKKKPREKTPAQKARDEERRKLLAARKMEMKQKMQESGEIPDVIIT